jgi:RecA-family ATPase
MPIQVYDGSTYLAVNFPKAPYVIDCGILPVGTRAILFGPPKKGKSMLVNQLAMSVIHGLPWLGFKTNVKKVLYGNFEVGHVEWQKRLAKYSRTSGLGMNGNLLLVSDLMGVKLDTPNGQAEMERLIAFHRPELIILDPLKKIISSSSTDENSVLACTEFIDKMLFNYGVSVFICHHTRKSKVAQSGVIDLGSQEMTGVYHLAQWVDSMISLVPVSTDRVRLEFECRHGEDEIKPINLKLNRNMAAFEIVP